MYKKFRALKLIAVIYKVVAWVVLVVGGLLALASVLVGALYGRVGSQSPLIADLPGLSQVSGVLSGLTFGILVLLGALVQFIIFYAANEVIELGLAIETNTRQTAHYLRGEGTMPPPPRPASWDTPGDSSGLEA